MQKQIPTEATPVGPTKIENAKQQTARFHHKNYSGIERKNLAVIPWYYASIILRV